MQIVIKIPDDHKRVIDNLVVDGKGYLLPYEVEDTLAKAVKNGTPLPKGHGDLIDRKLVLSDSGLCEFHMYDDYVKMRNYLKSISTVIEADEEAGE